MIPEFRSFRAKSAEIGFYGAAFVYQGPFEKVFSTGSRVINEVVLGTSVNKVQTPMYRTLPSLPLENL
jgi:hypothetical protein